MFNLWPIRPLGDTAEKRYKIFVVSRIMWRARKPLVIVLIGVLISFVSYVSYDHLYSSDGVEYIYKKYYERYDVTSEFNNNYIKAIENYQDGNSKEAVKLFNQMPQADSLNTAYYFYLALSYTDCHKYKETINLLENITELDDNIYYHPANWYLSLSYLKIYETEKARSLLSKMVEQHNPYNQEVLEVLELLDELND